jgi:hypothetical protein
MANFVLVKARPKLFYLFQSSGNNNFFCHLFQVVHSSIALDGPKFGAQPKLSIAIRALSSWVRQTKLLAVFFSCHPYGEFFNLNGHSLIRPHLYSFVNN